MMKLKMDLKLKQQGQVVVILLLIMVVILAVALSVASRSITEISTSANTENSSRAFSAAEAGIEKILQRSSSIELGSTGNLSDLAFSNQSSAQISWDTDLPKANTALEYPSFGKESFAQFWLIDTDLNCSNANSRCYNQGGFQIYFGENKDYSEDHDNEPAIEVNVIYKLGNEYKSDRYFYDSYSGNSDRINNQFRQCSREDPEGLVRSCWCGGQSPIKTNRSVAEDRYFYCRASVPPGDNYDTSQVSLIMARVRMLYTNSTHPVALKPAGSASLPWQTNIYNSTGSSGNIQRRLEVFREKDVMPQFFDYVLFSNQELSK